MGHQNYSEHLSFCLKPTFTTEHAVCRQHFSGVRWLWSWQVEWGRQGGSCRAPGLVGWRPHSVSGLLAVLLLPQILTCLLTEQHVVFFSSSWALLTLVAECFMAYLHPLQWQHTFVPILSRQMLDFVMAPTSFLMGCHLDHFEEVSKVRHPPLDSEH